MRPKDKEGKVHWERAAWIASSPTCHFYGKCLKKEVVVSIMKRARSLLKLGADAYYNSTLNMSYYDSMQSWQGLENYLNGSRDWMLCKGINNPFLINRATIET